MSIFDEDFDTDRPATERQIKYVLDLRADYESARNELAGITGAVFSPIAWGPLPETMTNASETIEAGKAQVHAMRDQRNQARFAARSAVVAAAKVAELAEGFYTDGAGTFWKVQESGSSTPEHPRFYAKVWNGESFEYEPGAIRAVAETGHPAGLDEAKAFGLQFGVCGICGRTLTNPESVAAGIGPVCAGRM